MYKYLLSIFASFWFVFSFAQNDNVRGFVVDKQTNEYLTGASVTLQSPNGDVLSSRAVGLNGAFSFSAPTTGSYVLVFDFMGYQQLRVPYVDKGEDQTYALQPNFNTLSAVEVQAHYKGTDQEARNMEKLSPNVINVISAKQIELSPDITVANVVQRVSGLSIERNANGDPQYAVVRGMNKRYNNTLVNGIKIPSPDNDNRFVPLDIFPAVFLEKLTVSKSLSADMEADAIGGTIDMIMKSVPQNRRLLEADFQLGGNTMSNDGKFITYDRSEVYKRSPAEYFGTDYYAVPGDFSPKMFTPINKQVLPDILASASYGTRLLNNKFGVLVGGSFQNSYRPNQSYFYDPRPNVAASNALNMQQLIERRTSTQQQRMAFHAKLDYNFSPKHTVSVYGGQYLLNEFRVREQYRRDIFSSNDNYPVFPTTRITNSYQTISIADLQGKHQLSNLLLLDWHLVYSTAKNELPDDGVFMRSARWSNAQNGYFDEQPYFQDSPNTRTWERNRDEDISAFVNATYKPNFIEALDQIKIGGMYRSKFRDNFYNYYRYDAIATLTGVRGEDWQNFGDLPWKSFTNGFGDGNRSSLVYDANEAVAAGYINSNWNFGLLALQVGLRAEHTVQGYEINANAAEANATDLSKEQRYINFFPSASAKYALATDNWLKATYYKAISRPGFFEIVPTRRAAGGGDSFYAEEGNPNLQPTIAHNFELRYELFPSALDQILVEICCIC
ncbi:TonB-dependent receptor [Sphingobacterium bambusae]|uniref:TonB-dependent receptor domain-containing protein n=1 Tax=Sphingobacterium bambusae TaxID=662858 RepID=A0ABW6BK48_9SPHI|nr:TonB-dependent receptor [Sphingobacterium bambusae]WPL49053.1 outer membrane beta-barrel protein [Sphingobacterium bambusae]